MDIRVHTLPIMIVAVGGMGERRGGPSMAVWIGGRGAEQCVVRESMQAGANTGINFR